MGAVETPAKPEVGKETGTPGSYVPQSKRLSTLSPHELGRVVELFGAVDDLFDPEEIFARVAAGTRGLLESDICTVLILDPDSSRLDVVAASGIDSEIARRLSTPVGENLAGLVAQKGKPLRCCDVPGDPRSELTAVYEAGISSAMLAPLAHHGEVFGVVAVATLDRRRFSSREQGLLQLLANHAATAIEKARLYAAEREHVIELHDLIERVKSQNVAMRQGREAHERLTKVALEGLGAEALVAAAADLVGVPLALVTQFGCLINTAPASDDSRIPDLWARCSQDARFATQLEEMRENAGLSEPAFVADAGFWRAIPAQAAGEVLGFIVALEHESLREVEITVLEQTANMVAAELLRERSVADAEARAHGDLLRSLMIGDVDGHEIRERAALLGHNLAEDQCVVVASLVDGKGIDPAVVSSAGSWASADIGLQGMLAIVDGRATAMLGSGDRDLSREAVEAWAKSFGDRAASLGIGEELRFGASTVAVDPGEIKVGFENAKQALAVATLEDSVGVTHFEDVELLATLISVVEPDALRRFVDRRIGDLEEYDERRGSALATTLEVYLDRSGVARHAASALYLHPHSLRYRLRRIKEIQRLDLEDPMDRLMTHLALKLRTVV